MKNLKIQLLIDNKEKLLKNIIEERALSSQNCTYIGDTKGDLIASQLNYINLILNQIRLNL